MPVVPDAILHGHLPIILGSFLTSFLEFLRSRICLYMGVSWVRGVGRDLFLTHFGPYFRPCFRALGNPTMLPTAQKIVGRYFAHPEQEFPSGKGSVSREVKKTRKLAVRYSSRDCF